MIWNQNRIFKSLSFCFTFLNAFAGILGFYAAIQGDFFWPLKFIIIGAVFDFWDGYFAKKSQEYSRYGAYMDSIADAITYVCVPSLVIVLSVPRSSTSLLSIQLMISLFYMICGFYRLICFLSKPPKSYFEGLPTSIAALVIGSLIVLKNTAPTELFFLLNNDILINLHIIIISVLMITHLNYPSHVSYSPFFKCLRGIGYLCLGIYLILSNFWTALGVFLYFWIYIIIGPYYMNKKIILP
ncbi:MAG: CDP-alcohol phosphatidyltransferase family protein [Promethearchaeota archaeon]